MPTRAAAFASLPRRLQVWSASGISWPPGAADASLDNAATLEAIGRSSRSGRAEPVPARPSLQTPIRDR